MRYFERQRMEWIVDRIVNHGSINRTHVVNQFEVTNATVAKDFANVMKEHPGLMHYNVSSKQYERCSS